MADRLVAIRKLLSHERQERRCAAAIVLAELGIRDKRSVNALTSALDDEDPQVRRYVLEALAQTDDESIVDKLIDALNDPDLFVQQAAETALLRFGDQAVPALQRQMEGPASVRRKVAAVLSRLQSSAGIESLIDSIDGSDSTVLDRARQALRTKGPELSATELRNLKKKLDQRLNQATHKKEIALSAALLPLLGDLPDDTVVTRIMKETTPDTPPQVRRAAIAAMMSALPQARGRRRDAAIERLLECLPEEDEDGVIRPTLNALKDVEVPERLAPMLKDLLNAPTASARAYALSELGRIGTPDSISSLVEQLITGSAPVRVAAREALAKVSESATPLAEALFEVSDPSRLQDIGELLKQHEANLPPEMKIKICVTIIDRIEAGEDNLGPLVETASRALSEHFLTVIRDRVSSRRSKKNLAGAFTLLNAIKDCTAFGDEERYQLAVLGLVKSADTSSRPPRATDRLCTPFAELLRVGFPIENRLRKESLVRVQDLYYLGFAFSESRDEDERDFGHELLEEVVQREPDSTHGSRAQNKINLTSR